MRKNKCIRAKTTERKKLRDNEFDESKQVFIIDEKKTFFKNKILISLKLNSTIKDLKDKISKKINLQEQKFLSLYVKESKDDSPSDIILRGKKLVNKSDLIGYLLYFEGKVLSEDNRKLIDYGIINFSKIQLISKEALVKGGVGMFSFVDLRKEKVIKIKFSENAPKYRIVESGLNILGLCTNKKCESEGNEVIVPIGFGEYDLGENISEMEIKCPICKQVVKPKTCGFTGCAYNFLGEIVEGKNIETFKTDTLEASEKYFSYYKPSEKLGKWISLKIYSVPLEDQETLKSTRNENIIYFDF